MSFERKHHLGLNLKECHFSTEINFETTTDEFQKNVIRSNDLGRKMLHPNFNSQLICIEKMH
jgi:hypothetical protein